MQKEITLLKEMVGVDPKTIVGATDADEKAALTVKKTFETDMGQFAATLPPEKQHYRDALESLWQTNQELFTASTELQNQFKQLQDQFKRREEERDTQIKQFSGRAEEQAKETVTERGKFEDDRQRINATSEDLNNQLAKKDAEKGQIADTAAKQEQVFKGEIKTLATDITLKNEKLRKLQTSQFEVAQGEVVNVNPHKKGTVYLNIGAADQLIPLVTFSVHDYEANTAQGDGLKGASRLRKFSAITCRCAGCWKKTWRTRSPMATRCIRRCGTRASGRISPSSATSTWTATARTIGTSFAT